MSYAWSNPENPLPSRVGGFGMSADVINIDDIRNNNGMPGSFYDQCYYDSIRLAGNTTFANFQNPTSFFAIPQGGQTNVANNPAQTYLKAFSDCNTKQAKQIPKGWLFQVNSIQIKVRTVGNLPTIATSGNNIGLPTNGGIQTNNTPPFADLNTLLNQMFIRLEIGSKTYVEGTLDMFPTAYCMSGAGMSATTASTTTLYDGFAQNGMGIPRIFTAPYFIPDLMNFQVDAFVYNGWTTPANYDFLVYCILDGYLYQNLQ